MIIPTSLQNRLAETAINKGSAFLSGQSTTVFATASNVMTSGGQVAGAVAGGAAGIAGNTALAIQTAQQLPILLTKEITAYTTQKLGEVMGTVLKMPSISDITDRAKSIMTTYVDTPEKILANLGKSSEDLNEELGEKDKESKLKKTQQKINDTMGKVNSYVSSVSSLVQEKAAMIVSYAGEGPKFLQDKCNLVEKEAKQFISEQCNKALELTNKYKQEAIESIATGAAKQLATATNAEQTRLIKNKLTKVEKTKTKATTAAKAAVGKALLKLYSLVGG